MRGHLLLTNCVEDEVTRENIELALKGDGSASAADPPQAVLSSFGPNGLVRAVLTRSGHPGGAGLHPGR